MRYWRLQLRERNQVGNRCIFHNSRGNRKTRYAELSVEKLEENVIVKLRCRLCAGCTTGCRTVELTAKGSHLLNLMCGRRKAQGRQPKPTTQTTTRVAVQPTPVLPGTTVRRNASCTGVRLLLHPSSISSSAEEERIIRKHSRRAIRSCAGARGDGPTSISLSYLFEQLEPRSGKGSFQSPTR